ncbi:MAG: AAA family ATPase, partial [Lachnospiraceae bacterium]|nr:AAA family ATPase [Lachnospiraceae bacterium]
PLAKASEHGYYDQMAFLIRSLFGQALKTNDSLEFAVLTGCLRISKESIFTGLNNLKVFSLTNRRFSQYFGFTDQEVRELLEYYGCAHCYGAVREWYDGYQFGSTNVYCPWDVLNYCDSFYGEGEEMPQNYWINTSGNDIIRTFIQMSEKSFARHEMEQLLSGGTVAKEIRQDLTYRDLYDSIENMWGVLFATGYLTSRGQAGDGRLSLAIPNKEVQEIFARQLIQYFQEAATKDGAAMEAFCTAVQEGDAAEVERRFQAYLRKTVSIHDYSVRNRLKENFYHGILLGFLSFKEGWTVASNRETGEGYSDIVIVIEEESTGVIIEVKYPQSGDLEAACQEALGQIGQMRYGEFLRDQGIQTIFKYGIACWKKRCKVVLEKELR